ncbi:MAG: hypothetical protein WD889_02155 [Candidatus Colwellbacteria bacterium]
MLKNFWRWLRREPPLERWQEDEVKRSKVRMDFDLRSILWRGARSSRLQQLEKETAELNEQIEALRLEAQQLWDLMGTYEVSDEAHFALLQRYIAVLHRQLVLHKEREKRSEEWFALHRAWPSWLGSPPW